mmetsp:Transcript_37980/g.80432  ORF Transcript_37980/g.80432 Transcript_37980/m.80432 type:complete len:215 (-) Transcript_37980:1429-2073(-)
MGAVWLRVTTIGIPEILADITEPALEGTPAKPEIVRLTTAEPYTWGSSTIGPTELATEGATEGRRDEGAMELATPHWLPLPDAVGRTTTVRKGEAPPWPPAGVDFACTIAIEGRAGVGELAAPLGVLPAPTLKVSVTAPENDARALGVATAKTRLPHEALKFCDPNVITRGVVGFAAPGVVGAAAGVSIPLICAQVKGSTFMLLARSIFGPRSV